MAIRPPWYRLSSYDFAEDLWGLMYDHERWAIEGDRIVHDTGIWIEVDRMDDDKKAFHLSIGLGDRDPVEVRVSRSTFDYRYDHLVQTLRRKAAQEMIDQMSVLVKLCT